MDAGFFPRPAVCDTGVVSVVVVVVVVGTGVVESAASTYNTTRGPSHK
jgi:hypothetical protein